MDVFEKEFTHFTQEYNTDKRKIDNYKQERFKIIL